MKYLRHITSVLILLLIAVLAAGTVVEKLHDSEIALAHVYGTKETKKTLVLTGVVSGKAVGEKEKNYFCAVNQIVIKCQKFYPYYYCSAL